MVPLTLPYSPLMTISMKVGTISNGMRQKTIQNIDSTDLQQRMQALNMEAVLLMRSHSLELRLLILQQALISAQQSLS